MDRGHAKEMLPVRERQQLADPDDVRRNVRNRVLWLACAMVHWANNVRVSPDGMKVGGHQSASASSVALLTALYFETLRAADRVAIKPHASPVFHAIQYLLGNLSEGYLERFRAFGGLQAYPSRTKDPDDVDYSTGAVGMGPAAVAFGALTRDYLASHDLSPTSGRFFAHIGDGELDEGCVWESADEPLVEDLDGCIWIIDLNRQSLDRVIPGIRIHRFRQMFEANGWQVITAKYGDRLTELMERPGGEALRTRIDDMSNEEYQGMLRIPDEEVRGRLLDGAGPLRNDLKLLTDDVPDAELASRIANLGGHDVGTLVRCYEEASATQTPSVVFAYTIKGWGLPTAGDPRNHSALLTQAQYEDLADRCDVSLEEPWAKFPSGSPEEEYIRAAADRLERPVHAKEEPIKFNETGLSVPRSASTQDAFGRMLVELDRNSPESAKRVVTVSPDVATSTNLASWINRCGVWSHEDSPDYLGFEDRILKWIYGPSGRHIELGISENNLFLLLGQLGLSEELSGRRLIPIGTVYDPFINRGLDALIYGVYQGSRFIAVATPSGISLSSEGGAHQGILTPGFGIGLPGTVYYEPAFARDLEWILLDSVRNIGSGEGESVILRLSTKPVDQSLFAEDGAGYDPAVRRRQALEGCYRVRAADPAVGETIHIFAVGPMVPVALEAADSLDSEGISANVFVITSPDLLYRRFRDAAIGTVYGDADAHPDPTGLLDWHELGRPVVTVIDGHSQVLSFLGSALQGRSMHLGVDAFGQSGSMQELYRQFGIDAEGVFSAALSLFD